MSTSRPTGVRKFAEANEDPELRAIQESIGTEVELLRHVPDHWFVLRDERLLQLQARCALIGHAPTIWMHNGVRECYYCGKELL